MRDASIFEEDAGAGYEAMGGDKFSYPMLLIAQPTSEVVTEPGANVKAGDFYNSITKESLGSKIEVIPAYFTEVWFEWKPNMGGLAGRHLPNSVKFTGNPYDGMFTPEGNELVATWCYLLLIKGHEEGMYMLQLKKADLKHAKNWNSFIQMVRLPSNKIAPFYSSSWSLETAYNKNDKGSWYTLGVGSQTKIKRVDYITQEELEEVKTIRQMAPSLVIKAPEEHVLLNGPEEKY